MYQAAVIFAPASPVMSAVADKLAQKLKEERMKVVRKEAAEATIPDITAADLVLLGSSVDGKKPIHGDFAEILRALQGINLAGRAVGVFALGSTATLQAFEKALADCEVPLRSNQFLNLPAAGAPDADLGRWVSSLIEQVGRPEAPDHGR